MSYLIYHNDVCRTGKTTQGLLVMKTYDLKGYLNEIYLEYQNKNFCNANSDGITVPADNKKVVCQKIMTI